MDAEVRRHVYGRLAEGAPAPTTEETAAALGIDVDEVERAYRRLHELHALVLRPGTSEIWMAHPFSAVPTDFEVEAADGRRWWANCAWDALGIPVATGADARAHTCCADCGERIELEVRGGELVPAEAVTLFVVPAARWWDDIGFT
jgi:DNA-binding transcriptional MocR family regulator